MEKLLKGLRENLKKSFLRLGETEGLKNLYTNEDSLFLAITDLGLKWQKKKIESVFEESSVLFNDIDTIVLTKCIEFKYVSECLKPSKKGYYFINLAGLHFIESKSNIKLINNLILILQNNLYQEISWNLKDEEKLIVSLLIIFNSFSLEKSFIVNNDDEIWDFMINKLAKGLEEIGLCNSFTKKIEDKSTKYASAKSFISGHPNILSRTGFYIPDNGKYYFLFKDDSDKKFLVDLVFSNKGYSEKVKFVELIEVLGRDLFMSSILNDKFEFDNDLRRLILH